MVALRFPTHYFLKVIVFNAASDKADIIACRRARAGNAQDRSAHCLHLDTAERYECMDMNGGEMRAPLTMRTKETKAGDKSPSTDLEFQ